MTIWYVDNRRGSSSGTVLTNVQGKEDDVQRSSLSMHLSSYFKEWIFPDGLSRTQVRSRSVMSSPPGLPVNYDSPLAIEWFIEEAEDFIYTGSLGNFAPNIKTDVSQLAVISYGNIRIAQFILDNTTETVIASYATLYTNPSKKSWIRWSDIGNLDFTIGRSNTAGERPMDWTGLIYKIKKLGSKMIVYGANGVSIVTPHGVNYGLQTILYRGLLGRNAMAGNDFEHFFIDSLGDLYHYAEKLELLGYAEVLSGMDSPVLSLDHSINFLYICDGVSGYVYSIKDKSMGEGPINITGVDYQNSNRYIAAAGDISMPVFEIWTDIIDFGIREDKTLQMIEVGTNVSNPLEASIEYINQINQSFIRLPWQQLGPNGIIHTFCHGKDFRIGLRLTEAEYLELDYISIEGRIT